MTTLELPDIQETPPRHAIAIDNVGIRGLRYPATLQIAGSAQPVVGTFTLSVGLADASRGTHMSRFVEELARDDRQLSVPTLFSMASSLIRRLGGTRSTVIAAFPFFLERSAPVSGLQALVDYEGRIAVQVDGSEAVAHVRVRVPVTSLCPCSKEISDYGAHSQRGYVTIDVASRIRGGMGLRATDLSHLVEIAESAASAPIFSLLKREDERSVTMAAYDRPAFVEDVVREIAAALLNSDAEVDAFRIDVDNEESIHNHSAWALVERGDLGLLGI